MFTITLYCLILLSLFAFMAVFCSETIDYLIIIICRILIIIDFMSLKL